MKPRIHLINNTAAHYSGPMLLRFLKSDTFNFYFTYGVNKKSDIKILEFNKKEYQPFLDRIGFVKSLWASPYHLIWQRGTLSRCLLGERVELIVLSGEVQIVSNWLCVIACRIRGIPVAFRTHGLYGNENRPKHFLRICFYKLANIQMVYERRSKRLLTDAGLNSNNIHVIFNSLDYASHKKYRSRTERTLKSEVYDFFDDSSLQTLLFVGRLEANKKLDFLIRAVEKIQADSGVQLNLLFVGDGSERQRLENTCLHNLKSGTYHFYGSCYDESILGELLSNADMCVSPGNIGLTCIHSLSMGTPVCTHNNFKNQGPEVEAIDDGENGVLFIENDLEDLCNKITAWLVENPIKTRTIFEICYRVVDEYYNPAYQEKVFLQAAMKKNPLL